MITLCIAHQHVYVPKKILLFAHELTEFLRHGENGKFGCSILPQGIDLKHFKISKF